MDPATVPVVAPMSVVFRDGLGERRRTTDPTGKETVDLLCLSTELTAVPSFEFALRERVSRLAGFRHPSFSYVRSVDRANHGEPMLTLASDSAPGSRLSDILAGIEQRKVPLDINAALSLIRQVVTAIGTLHQHERDMAHGALAPERIVITPRARMVIVEYAMGAALEQLRYSHQRYWKDLRIALPRSAGLPRFDHRADVTQVGLVALSLILGRQIREDEFPVRIPELVASAWAISATGDLQPLPAGLRAWLSRALQIDIRNAFATALEAGTELEKVLAADNEYGAEPAAVEAFLQRYHAAVVSQPSVVRAPAPAPVRVEAPQAMAPQPVTPRPAAEPALPASTAPSVPPMASAIRPAPAPQYAPATPVVAAAPPRPPAPLPAPPPPAPVMEPIAAAVTLPPAKMTPRVEERELREDLPWDRVDKDEKTPARAEVAFPFALGQDNHELAIKDEDEDEGTSTPRRWQKLAAAAVVLVAVAGAGLVGVRRYAFTGSGSTGTLIVTTNPAGAQVSVDGQARGSTPITLELKAGAHTLELQGTGAPRTIAVSVPAGTQVSQYIELTKGSPTTGQLQVRTDPPGAIVTVDSVPRGTSPITIGDLKPGEHIVVLASDAGTVTHTVTVEPGMTASLVAPLAAAREAAPSSGWISVTSPVDVQLYENGRLLGTSQTDRIMVASGSHQIDLVNDTLNYRVTRTLQVAPGRVTPVAVKLPMGSIALNAVPWAEVWIDGEKVGETPVGNLQTSIGTHEVVFRHPELGEQRRAVTVTLATPARVSVDMRQK